MLKLFDRVFGLKKTSFAKAKESNASRNRIGIITTWYERGVSYQSRFLCSALKKLGYDIYILAHKERTPDERDWGYRKLTFFKHLSPDTVIAWIKAESPSIVFFPDRLEDEKVLNFCARNGVATVMIINYETVKPDEIKTYKKYTKLWCPVRCTEKVLNGMGVRNTHFIRWAIDTSIFSPNNEKMNDTVRFIHNAGWGGVYYRKNTEAVLAAFDKASKRVDNIELLLKTQKKLSEYPEAVQRIARENPKITVNEENLDLDELLALHRGCHVSLLPSKWEGIGLPFLESLSMGMPVLTVDAPPMNEWIVNDFNGYRSPVAAWEKGRKEKSPCRSALVDVEDYARQIERFSNAKFVRSLRQNCINSALGYEKDFLAGLNEFVSRLSGAPGK